MPDSIRVPFEGAITVGIPRETAVGERRVAATPSTVQRLKRMGVITLVQAGAGEGARILDSAYAEAGARIVPTAEEVWGSSDLILKVRPPAQLPDSQQHEADLLKLGACLVSFIWPGQSRELIDRLAARKATVLAMDAVPRITRAQKLDALSAMANIAGYRAVIEASERYGWFLGGQITAAGRVKPAQVLVVGAGVAGLAAVAAARSLGGMVRAFDTRPAVREQVESLGGRFVEFKFEETGDGEGGYAKQMSEAYLAAEQALLAHHCHECDIVITTALIPGVPAPKLITSGAVVEMRRGSVIVDLAAEQGGNCALTERDQVVERFGVSIVGLTDLTSRMAPQASELYAATLVNLLDDMVREGKLVLDVKDEVQRGMLVLHDGTLMWPPPKPSIRAGAPRPTREHATAPPPPRPTSPWPVRIAAVIATAVLIPIGLYAPQAFLQHLTVFVLACVVGWHVVWNVTPALHTPLMSVTNAVSGIILVGAMLLTTGNGHPTATLLGAVAALLAAINVAGGFLVTQRMLRMFRR